jgi:diguanylate cyclase (GGDEF)-like protein
MLHRKEVGQFPGDVDAYCNWFDDQLRTGKPAQWTLEPGDGRSIHLFYQPLGDGSWVTTVEDVTARRRAEERIAHLAHYDPLTDLPNRVLFRERLEFELKALADDEQCAVLYIDIDEFKSINDSLGHPIGDELLKAVGGRLRDCVGDGGFVARLGGDEFAVVQHGVGDRNAVTALVTRLHDAIREPCDCLGHHISSDASIGVALAPQHGRDLDQLLKHADLAMYAAKADGRRTWRLFEPEMDARVKTRQQLEQDLRQIIASGAYAEGGFEIHYQPVVCLGDGFISGCEALLRWTHPQRGAISPAEFIPVAEDTGLICQLGEWVLSSACREAASWPDAVKIAVNVSPIQFRSPTLALHVVSALASSGLAADRLELEITEAVLIRDDDTALNVLTQLRAFGVRTALDDFGTGYSSLSYLQRFPFDKIKIDRTFVKDIAEVDGSAAIVQAVVNIASSRAMMTTAEGVETEAQRDCLRALGCSQMQGFLFSAARPAAEIRPLLRKESGKAA